MPFKPTVSPLKTSLNLNKQNWDSSSQNQLANYGQSYHKVSSTSKPLVSGTWSLITTLKPIFGENSKPIYAELSPSDFQLEGTNNYQNENLSAAFPTYANSDSNYANPTSTTYAEISSTSKTNQVLANAASWPTVNSNLASTFKPENSGFQEIFPDLKPTQNVDPTGSDLIVGFPQYDPSSVTQIPNLETFENQSSSQSTRIHYKPTFKPFIPEVNETQFSVDNTFLIDELEELEAEGVTEVAPSLVVESSEDDTIAVLATMLAEKFDVDQMSEAATKYFNQVTLT
jgi:hypothetical protein